MSALRKLHTSFVGPVETTSMQSRIFHEVSLLGMLAIPISLVINSFIGVHYVNIILIFTFLCISILYYNSRHLNNLRWSVIAFTICSNLLLAVNYFFNSGVSGPTLLIFLLSVVFTVAVMPSRKSLIWISINAVIVALMLYLEYSNPNIIKNTYSTREGFFIDTLTSYLAVTVCIILVLSYLIKSQHLEKMKAIDASKALQEANDTKTKLLSILSHDLRSPLNSIQSFLEILVNFDLEEDERKAIKASLLKETKGTQNMLSNLLSWTKSQMEGGVKVKLIPVNLHEAMEMCIKDQFAAAAEKTISIFNTVASDLVILADLDMLKLVIRNLLNNAIKFTMVGGAISVSSDCIDDICLLTVTDNGIGIDKDRASGIFTMNAISTYGTSNEKGVGLGLMLCKEFTELQNGKITLDTSPEKGTSFTLHFPVV
jgi:two-component system sensor histidine kinase/response regulator